jgi:predicted O-methyltransferase YrrM
MLYFTIVENNFKSGFEIATAFGYSTEYLGLAFQKTGGKCISLDCYIEEFKEMKVNSSPLLKKFVLKLT